LILSNDIIIKYDGEPKLLNLIPMKTVISFFLLIFISQSAFSQMKDGKYKFSNEEITLNFTTSEEGSNITEITLINHKTNKTITGEGEWFTVNENGADASYDGPTGWYQFQTSECNYSFDIPKNNLILSQYECQNGLTEKEFVLYQK